MPRSLTIISFLLYLVSFEASAQKQFKALLITKTAGFQHESVHAGVTAIQKLAVRNNFDVALLDNPANFTDKHLQQFQVLIFLNTTGDILDNEQQQVMERFIRSGKGFVGIHSASDTEYEWEWYTKLIGHMFRVHPKIQTAKVSVTDKPFPGLNGFDPSAWWTDEWYEFGPVLSNDLTYVLKVDESTYSPATNGSTGGKGEGMGAFHPVAWYHNYDGGRAFYTALGHMASCYEEPAFINHLYSGLFWAATGKK